MPETDRMSGVLCPVITPLNDDLSPNPDKLIRQCQWLLSKNVGLAIFGTNSEANSLSVEEKIELLDRIVDSGIDVARIMPGTGCCALPDTVRLTTHAVRLGCAGTLMLPPFFYKNVDDDGLYASYSEVIERVGSGDLRVYLYHIPPVSQVGLSIDLIERLLKSYPETVVGIKDSSGDWSNTSTMLERCWDKFQIFAGSEIFLLRTMRNGGAGCISATANINPAAIHELYATWQSEGAAQAQAQLDSIREIVQRYPMIPALKAIVANFGQDSTWETVRPPLVSLCRGQVVALIEALVQHGFAMPGLADQDAS
ncbi:MAG: dihydrodipicolinate synthase family protein [Gammaproteobacteria bacterium]|nr:dihydrodipicolinate synthase family protein [Gammaproteobacteria bacterium]